MDNIYLIGHKNPDTDATVAPIVLSWYFNNYEPKNTYIPVIFNKPNKETEFVLKTFGIKMPITKQQFKPGQKLILVDTSNPDELPVLDDLDIIGIFDHHKLGGIKTPKPIEVFIQPVGSSVTVLYQYFIANGLTINDIPEDIAGLIACGIISDTLNLKSPTTTEIDKNVLSIVAERAGITDINKLAQAMFDAKSSLEGLTPVDILTYDAKEYNIDGKRTLVAVFETVRPEKLFEKHVDLLAAIDQLKKEKQYDYVLFFVIDVLNQTGYYMLQENQADEFIKNGYRVTFDKDDRFVELKGVVSRKKQIIPVLEKFVI